MFAVDEVYFKCAALVAWRQVGENQGRIQCAGVEAGHRSKVAVRAQVPGELGRRRVGDNCAVRARLRDAAQTDAAAR